MRAFLRRNQGRIDPHQSAGKSYGLHFLSYRSKKQKFCRHNQDKNGKNDGGIEVPPRMGGIGNGPGGDSRLTTRG